MLEGGNGHDLGDAKRIGKIQNDNYYFKFENQMIEQIHEEWLKALFIPE